MLKVIIFFEKNKLIACFTVCEKHLKSPNKSTLSLKVVYSFKVFGAECCLVVA